MKLIGILKRVIEGEDMYGRVKIDSARHLCLNLI